MSLPIMRETRDDVAGMLTTLGADVTTKKRSKRGQAHHKASKHCLIKRVTVQNATNAPNNNMSFLKKIGKASADIIPGLGHFVFDPTVGKVL